MFGSRGVVSRQGDDQHRFFLEGVEDSLAELDDRVASRTVHL